MNDITVAIPSHLGREQLLKGAIGSVLTQSLPAAGISVAIDRYHRGAAETRNAAVAGIQTEWTALLDSDDVFYPDHLETLLGAALDTGADYTFSWFDMLPGTVDPLKHIGKVFDPANPHQTTITILVRTELLQTYPFHLTPLGEGEVRQQGGEDWNFTLDCIRAGAKIVHVPKRTWLWRHHGYGVPGRPGNTSGMGDRW